jgi:hypothetical protein
MVGYLCLLAAVPSSLLLPEVKCPLSGRSFGAIDVAASVRKCTVQNATTATLPGSNGQKLYVVVS